MRPCTALAALALTAPLALAQWTSNPLVNTHVVSGPGDQATPLIRPTSDGGAWVVWADNAAGGGYRHKVQLLDAQGVSQFPAAGITINTRNNTAIFAYDMAIDAANNAFVAYDDNGIWLRPIEPDGTLRTNLFMPGSAPAVGPQVCVCGDGSLVVCYTLNNVLNFQRIEQDGTLDTSWTLAEDTRGQAPSDLIPSGPDRDFILLWVRSETTNMVTSRKGLKIQKWDSNDTAAWNGGVAIDVYASSATPSRGIQNGYFPPLVSDGAGGAVVAWYDTGADRNAWVQHIRSDGSAVFPVNGFAASTTLSSAEYRLSAAVAYRANTGIDDYAVVYETSNPTQSMFGLRAQNILDNGVRQWGGAGATIVPTAGFHCSFATINAFAPNTSTGPVATWLQYTGTNGPMQVQSTRLDINTGAPVWTPAVLGVSTSPVTKTRLGVIKATGADMLIAAWADGASGGADILAQNININGTLGPAGPTCDSVDFNNDGLFPDTQDLSDFLAVYAGAPCPTTACGDIDFNNDALFPDTTDIDALLSVFSGGPCL
jgi:hypothetical protein